MARVTVEDCVIQVPNRFDLVMLAAHRARALTSGAELTVERDRDKNPVVALREIAEQKLDLGNLNEALIKNLQKRVEPDRPEEEVTDLMASEQQNWINASMGAEDDDDLDGEAEMGDEDMQGDDGFTETVTFEDADIKD